MNESEEGKRIEERKEKFKKIFLGKGAWVWLVLLFLIIIAFYTRTVNIDNLKDITTNNYTLGPDLDPFLFLRYAKSIVQDGSLMKYDSLRYVPLGYDTAKETRLLPYMIAYFHNFISIFKDVSVEYSAALFPAVMFLFTAIAFFLFSRKIFEKNEYKNFIALLATAFFIVSPSLLSRTVAGIPEKESVGFLFLFLGFYFLLCSWNSEKIKRALGFAVLAGLSTAFMGLIWGGWIYIFITIAVAFFIAFMLGKVQKKEFYSYTIWLFLSIGIVVLLSQRYTLKGLFYSTSTGLSLIVFSLLLIDFLIFNTRIKEKNLVRRAREKCPDKVISLGVFIVLGLVFSSLFLGISFIPNFIQKILSQVRQPYWDRFSFTVAENRQPYFSEWKGSFGPAIKNIPLFFWLFFIGSIFLFYEALKRLEIRKKMILVPAYVIFLLALIFSRSSADSLMNGENGISQFVYFGGFLLFVIAAIYCYYKYYKEGNLADLKKINFGYIVLFSYFIISLIGARSAIRLIMALAPPASILVGYFAVAAFSLTRKPREDLEKLIVGAIVILIILSTFYALYFNYQVTVGSARAMVPSIYTHQWQNAMAWVRNNTAEDAVFSHWWDYGYWLQSLGERPTVLDGGNLIVYWDHLLGRHVLTGQSETEALEFLYAHNVSYLLIDSTDIGKYPAYSSIGSDENYDRYSQLVVFNEDKSMMQETVNGTIHVYSGGTFLDEDLEWKQDGTDLFFPSRKTYIIAVLINFEDEDVKSAEVVFYYQGNQFRIPLRYVYFNNTLYDFEKGYEGTLYLMPLLIGQSQLSVNEIGAGLFITQKVMKSVGMKLYLFNNADNFELVHSEPDIRMELIRKQGVKLDDFAVLGGIMGPIKIWKVNYPEGIEFKPEYLETEYPREDLRIAKQNF